MKRRSWKFVKDEEGYVAVLALISMPFLMGLALLVMDVGRGNNLHTDVQQAVDAIALAGARELDGGPSSIDRAEAVMAGMLQNQTRFSSEGIVIMDGDRVEWQFLHSIPPHDDTPIDASYVTTDPLRAEYVQVRSLDQPMGSWFLRTVGLQEDVPFSAEAVATYTMAACDVTPLFICNPFELTHKPSFSERFAEGALYGRQLTLNFSGGQSVGPGNFGWLQVAASGGDALRDALATGKPGMCYERDGLTTKTGGTIGPAEQGINVRFGIYAGSTSASNEDHRPAVNVRKGASNPLACNNYSEETDPSKAFAFPSASLPGGEYGNQTLPGGTLSGDNWDFATYWTVNHPGIPTPTIPRTSHPDPLATGTPSRYDVYRYEIDNDLIDGDENMAPNGETGEPICYTGETEQMESGEDRRIVFAAVVNCHATPFSGQTTFTPTEGFVSMFLTKPMTTLPGNDKRVHAEVIDVTGNSGRGTLDVFLREEAVLVR